MMPMPKPKVVHVGLPTSENRPNCPRHGVRMQYNPERAVFFCPEDSCGKLAWPREEVFDKPVVGTGDVTLVVSRERNKLWLRSENNVMVELSLGDNINLVMDSVHEFQTVDGQRAWWLKIGVFGLLELD